MHRYSVRHSLIWPNWAPKKPNVNHIQPISNFYRLYRWKAVFASFPAIYDTSTKILILFIHIQFNHPAKLKISALANLV